MNCGDSACWSICVEKEIKNITIRIDKLMRNHHLARIDASVRQPSKALGKFGWSVIIEAQLWIFQFIWDFVEIFYILRHIQIRIENVLQIGWLLFHTQHLVEFVQSIQCWNQNDVTTALRHFVKFDASDRTVFAFSNIKNLLQPTSKNLEWWIYFDYSTECTLHTPNNQ